MHINPRATIVWAGFSGLLAAFFGLFVTGCGCDGSPEGQGAVSGTVTENGAPVAALLVFWDSTVDYKDEFHFMPRLSAASNLKDGKFELLDRERNPGTPPGEYDVRVFKLDPKLSRRLDSNDPIIMKEAFSSLSALVDYKNPTQSLPADVFPPKIQRITVPEGGMTGLEFKLEEMDDNPAIPSEMRGIYY